MVFPSIDPFNPFGPAPSIDAVIPAISLPPSPFDSIVPILPVQVAPAIPPLPDPVIPPVAIPPPPPVQPPPTNPLLLNRSRDTLSAVLERMRQRREKQKNVARQTHCNNYILTHRFYVEIGGVIRAAFSECSGFGLDVKKEQYLEGGVNHQQRVLLGHAEFQDTVLKRGMTNDPVFWEWMREILEGRAVSGQASTSTMRSRRSINILMMNQSGKIMQLCTLIGAVPIGWKAPAFQADSNAVAIEEMTLAYEGINLRFHGPEMLNAGGATSLASRDVLGFFPET